MKRFEDLGVRLGETLWNMLGGEETRPKVLTMANVKRYMYEVMEDNPMVVGCALSIERRGDHYEVIQLMIDSKEEAIKRGRGYLGRTIQAQELDESIVSFMNGEKQQKLMA